MCRSKQQSGGSEAEPSASSPKAKPKGKGALASFLASKEDKPAAASSPSKPSDSKDETDKEDKGRPSGAQCRKRWDFFTDDRDDIIVNLH